MTRSPRMSPVRNVRVLAVAAMFVVASACGGDDGDGATDAAAGQEAFETHCISCHGQAGQGTDQGPPLVHIVYEPNHHSDESFRGAVRDGVVPHHWDFGPMPPIPGISDNEVEAVITYVRELQREAGIE
jgi:mono/diheme cytochrome c family protein